MSAGVTFKQCTRCHESKHIEEFGIDASRKDGHNIACKDCIKERSQRIRDRNRPPKVIIPEGYKKCGTCQNIKPITEFGVRRVSKDGLMYCCKLCARRGCREWRKDNPEKVRESNKKCRFGKLRPKNANANGRRYYWKNRVRILARGKQLLVEKRLDPEYLERERVYRNSYYLKRSKMPQHKIRSALHARLHKILKRAKQNKTATTLDFLGCSLDYFMRFIERKFQPGMTWENYGFDGWHIDHRKPCAAFDLSDEMERRWCFHYSNLQPMWAHENMSKGKKYANA